MLFFLGADEKLVEHLSDLARERISVAISFFTAISKQLIQGNIKINLLNYILEKKDTFTELLKIGMSTCWVLIQLSSMLIILL